MSDIILSVKELALAVKNDVSERFIVKWINFDVPRYSMFSLVGGSGSGKTTVGLAIQKLFSPGVYQTSGNITFDNHKISDFKNERMRQIRGKQIGMIFQEPLETFNPVFTVGSQIEEVFKAHTDLNRAQRKIKAYEFINLVGFEEPKRIYNSYPFELSGGMRQRAMIAQAICLNPKLIIADEPTSNLDVTLQAKIMELFVKLKQELGLTIILISHDLGLISKFSDYVAVMREGRIVETGRCEDVLHNPKHEYSKRLMQAIKI